MTVTAGYDTTLPRGVRARFVDNSNGLRMHVLEAGHQPAGRPCVLLLHGFPELAFSWRKVIPALAAAGYHVVAPDQRGYGRTTGWDRRYDGDLASFRFLNLVRDIMGLLAALGVRRVAGVAGHDFGSPVAACCALIRPDLFPRVALMSAPVTAAPALALTGAGEPAPGPARLTHADPIHAALAALPRPRKHYHAYYSTREADGDMRHCPQGVHHFLRAYFHHKSADWPGNRPYRLQDWTAEELAKLPTYYVMDLHEDMAGTVAREMPSPEQVAACTWLSEDELAVYAGEFARTGFQGGLQWYRCRTGGLADAEMQVFAGRTIDVAACFIAGTSDWGVFQSPGVYEAMQRSTCTRMLGAHLLPGAGHWVQQEQPEAVVRLLLELLAQPE